MSNESDINKPYDLDKPYPQQHDDWHNAIHDFVNEANQNFADDVDHSELNNAHTVQHYNMSDHLERVLDIIEKWDALEEHLRKRVDVLSILVIMLFLLNIMLSVMVLR